jgi:hypothetical protein
VGSLELITRKTTTVIDLPELTRVSREMYLDGEFAQVKLPNLQSAGSLTIAISNNNNTAALDEIDLPELTEIEYMDINRFPELTRINLPKLKKANTIHWDYNQKLASIYTPLLEEVTEIITWRTLLALQEMDFPKLRMVKTLEARSSQSLESVSFPLVTEVQSIDFDSGWAIKGFTALQSAGTITLTLSSGDNNMVFPSSLKRIDYLKIYGQNYGEDHGTIDVHGIAVNTIDYEKYNSSITLIGDDVFHGTLKMQPASTITAGLPTIQGFKEVDSLFIYDYQSVEFHLRGIRKVNRGAYLRADGNLKEYSLPDMEEIGGHATFSISLKNASATATTISLPKLKSIGGNFDLTITAHTTVETLSCPELARVGGNFTLSPGYDYVYLPYYNYRGLDNVQFPKLTTVDGKLMVTSDSYSYKNNRTTNLNGFSALTSVKAIEITKLSALTDYSGLKNAFEAHPWGESDWSVSNNAYNPTYQDLLDGKWTKP